jgi:hypothetical protein
VNRRPRDVLWSWKNESYRRLGYGLVLVSIGVFAALITAPGVAWWGAGLIACVAAAMGVTSWLVYVSPFIAISVSHELIVRNPTRLHTVPVSAISSIESGPRLVVRCNDAAVITVWCVQASNAALMLGRRTIVDDVAGTLSMRVSALRAGVDPTPIKGSRLVWRPYGLIVAAGAVITMVLRVLIS